MNDNGRSRMVARWNHEEREFDAWKETPAGAAALAKLRAFFEREARCHAPPVYETRHTANGTPYRVLKRK